MGHRATPFFSRRSQIPYTFRVHQATSMMSSRVDPSMVFTVGGISSPIILLGRAAGSLDAIIGSFGRSASNYPLSLEYSNWLRHCLLSRVVFRRRRALKCAEGSFCEKKSNGESWHISRQSDRVVVDTCQPSSSFSSHRPTRRVAVSPEHRRFAIRRQSLLQIDPSQPP